MPKLTPGGFVLHPRTVLVHCLLLLAPALSQAQLSPVGNEFIVNSITTNAQRFVAAAARPQGDFVVVWSDKSTIDDDNYATRLRFVDAAGTPQGSDFHVNTYTTASQDRPEVSVASDGGFVVVWESAGQDGSSDAVVARRFSSSGAALGNDFVVNSTTGGQQRDADVGLAGNGDFVVVWQSPDAGAATDVRGQRFASNGSTVGSEFLVNTITIDGQNAAAVDVDSDGDFIVVWSSAGSSGSDNDSTSIQGQLFSSSGASIGDEFQINSYTPGAQSSPTVAFGSSGTFVVAWQSNDFGYPVTIPGPDGDGIAIRAQRFASDGSPLGGEFTVNTYTTGDQSAPSIAVDGSSRFIVSWLIDSTTAADGSGDSVRARAFDADGTPFDNDFQVNTYTTSSQRDPEVTITAAGQALIAWESLNQDGSGRTVVARRYELPVFPDLTISAASAPATASSGGNVTVDNTVMNAGFGAAGGFDVAIRLSENELCSSLDTFLAMRTVASLGAGADDAASTNVTIPGGTSAGLKHLCVLADDGEVIAESDENNNSFALPIAIDALFVDGFESGNTSAWSATVP